MWIQPRRADALGCCQFSTSAGKVLSFQGLEPDKTAVFSWQRLLTGFGLVLAVYLVLSIVVPGPDLATALLSFPVQAWLLILALSAINYALRSWRWIVYLDERDKVPTRANTLAYLSGFALTATPGKVGEVYRCLLLANRFGVRYAGSTAVCFFERLLDLAVIALLCVFIFWAAPSTTVAVSIAAVLIVVVGALIGFTLLDVDWLWRFLPDLITDRLAKARAFADGFLQRTRHLLKPRALTFGLATGLVAWGLEGVGLAIILDVMNVPLPLHTAVAIYAVAMLIGGISMLPGGVGTSEATMIFLLHQQGVDLETSAAATLICRIATLWFSVVVGALCIPMFLLGQRPQANPKEAEELT